MTALHLMLLEKMAETKSTPNGFKFPSTALDTGS
jgi:hypothetical protein